MTAVWLVFEDLPISESRSLNGVDVPHGAVVPVLCRPPFHVVIFFDFPSFSAVMRLLSLPVKRIRLHFTESPTYRQAVGIQTAQDDTVALTPALRTDDVVELRIYKNHTPLLERAVSKNRIVVPIVRSFWSSVG